MSSDLSKEERIGIKTAVAEAAATTDVQNLLREDVKNSTTKGSLVPPNMRVLKFYSIQLPTLWRTLNRSMVSL